VEVSSRENHRRVVWQLVAGLGLLGCSTAVHEPVPTVPPSRSRAVRPVAKDARPIVKDARVHVQLTVPDRVGLHRLYAIDWSPARRKAWQAAVAQGPVVVGVDGTDIRLVPGCRLDVVDGYRFVAEPPEEWYVDIQDLQTLRTHGLPVDRGQLELMVVPTGTWTAGLRPGASLIAQEPRGNCEGATHYVSAVRVGSWIANWERSQNQVGQRCAVSPTTDAPPPGCDVPWLVELVPFASPAQAKTPLCPEPLTWDGFTCRLRSAKQAASVTCTVAGPSHPACRRWPRGRMWDFAVPFPVGLAPDPTESVEGSQRLATRLKTCLCNQVGAVEVGAKFGPGRELNRLLEVWARAPTLPEQAAACLQHQLYGFRPDQVSYTSTTLQFEVVCGP